MKTTHSTKQSLRNLSSAKATEHDKIIGFVKHYCTMIRIGNQGRLTPESIALEKLLDALIKRDNRS